MKINKNLQFTINTIILIVMTIFLIYDFLLVIYNPKINLRGIPAIERINIYYAFWTTQTNYIVVIYLLVTFYLKSLYGKKRLLGLDLAVTTYINVTFIVFWFGLVLSKSEASNYTIANWISTITLHLIIPSIMVYWFIQSAGREYMNWREFGKGLMVVIVAYPILYLVFVMIRGEMRFQIYGNNELANKMMEIWSSHKNDIGIFTEFEPYYDTQMFYPYWFLDYRSYTLDFFSSGVVYNHTRGWWWIIITIISIFAISGLFIFFGFFYLQINNNVYYLWHDIHGRWLSNEEHKYQIVQRKIYFKNLWSERKIEKLHEKQEKREFRQSLSTLSKSERDVIIRAYNKEQNQKKVEKLWRRKVDRIITKNEKKELKRILSKLPKKDAQFIINNIRDAKRYQKLVKKRVLTTKKVFD